MENLDDVPVKMSRELFNVLHADASRYRAIRTLICETDEVKQERISSALGDINALGSDDFKHIEPAQFDAFVDATLNALQEARDADG